MAKAKPQEAEPVENGKEVVSLQDRIQQRLAKVNETTTSPGSSKISVKGSMFTLPDGKASKGPLNCIILDYINQNAWYENDFVEGQFALPDCSAMGREIKTMAPSDDVEKKQSDTCDTCPKNEFGSKGRGKACQNGVLLAIVPEEFNDETEVFTIRVSATGLKDWAKYVRELSEVGNDPIQMITSLSFKDGLAYPSLKFHALKPHGKLDELARFMPSADTLLSANA